jgi:hypothetical protein
MNPRIGGGFSRSKIVGHYKGLEWPSTVYGSNFARLSACCARIRPKVSGRKLPFPKMVFVLGSSRPTAGGWGSDPGCLPKSCSQMSKIAASWRTDAQLARLSRHGCSTTAAGTRRRRCGCPPRTRVLHRRAADRHGPIQPSRKSFTSSAINHQTDRRHRRL